MDMGAQYIERTFIDKISIIFEDLKNCLNQMNIEEVENIEKCIVSLFKFHKTYLEAKNHLINILETDDDKKKNELIEKLRQEHELFFKENIHGG